MERYPDLKGKALAFLIFLWWLWFINMGARVLFAPLLPLIEDEFVITHARASSVFVFLSAGYAFSMFSSGFYSGAFGYRRSITLSLSITSLAFFLIPFAQRFSLLYLFGFIIGLSGGMYLPAALPLITEYYSEKQWGKSIVIHDSGAPVAIFSIPFIVLFLLHFVNWRGVFQVLGFVFLMGAVIFYLVSREVKIEHSQKGTFGGLVKKSSLWTLIILSIFAAGANLGLYAIFPLYVTKELSMTLGYANTVLGISRLGGIIVAIMAGFFIDRVNLRSALFVIMLGSGVLTVLTAVASIACMPVFLFFQAVVVTCYFPVILVVVTKVFNRESRGMATGLILTLCVVLGGGVMPYLLGLAGDYIGFRLGILILGILVSLSSPLTLRLEKI
ncbi:MAG: putative transporter [Syntrophorhabdaceae bacterium PtaU1.Bin034]|nr:MAG: putative transporter [Syntrophorhabdaceae bacterium PtaU1.Bin034]